MSNLRDVLTEIYRERGELTPQLVVNEARDPAHQLHSRFEWDDTIAGEAYRQVQAAEIIRSVKLVYSETPKGGRKYVRAFSSLNQTENTAKGYVPTEELVRDDISRRLLLQQLKRDIETLKRKYGHLKEFGEMVVDLLHQPKAS